MASYTDQENQLPARSSRNVLGQSKDNGQLKGGLTISNAANTQKAMLPQKPALKVMTLFLFYVL